MDASLGSLPTWLIIVLLVITGFIATVSILQRISHGRLRLSQMRTERFWELTKGTPLARQLAASEAFGVVIDNRVLELAEAREDSLGLIYSYRSAMRYVRVANGRFIERESSRWSLKRRADGAFGAIIALLLLIWLGLIFAKSIPESMVIVILALLFTFPFIAVLLSYMSANLGYAHLLVNQLDRLYPLRAVSTKAKTSSE